MICIASLIVFSILGIFSAKHRALAAEAFNCLLSKAVAGECDSSFEDRMRATVLTPLLGRFPRTAAFVDRHMEKLAAVFVILLLVTLAISLRALVFLYLYGSCAGPETSCTASGILDAVI